MNKNVKKSRSFRKNKNVITSVQFASEGFWHVLKNERNFKIHIFAVILVIIFSVLLKINYIEAAILSITCGMVLIAEVLNTAVEAVVDLYCKDNFSYLGKIAKDCGAGAVLIAAVNALIIGYIIFFDKLIALLGF